MSQAYLTGELTVTKKLTAGVMAAIKVLAVVEQANQLARRLPPEAFYNELIRCDIVNQSLELSKLILFVGKGRRWWW